MEKKKVLFISQEIAPYMPETEMSKIGRFLPQGIQEGGKEIRAFMPRYGVVKERRHQLHEVIRLSGINIIFNDTDHSLIIKVASIQTARMQVYFIDNEEYFHRKSIFHDKDGNFFEDNDERSIFFSRGVLETIKKLRWSPDIIHCHGWFGSLVPIYIKKSFKEDPIFSKSKVVISLYNDDFEGKLSPDFTKKLLIDGIKKKDVQNIEEADYVSLYKFAIDHSDGIIQGNLEVNDEIKQYALNSGKPFLEYQTEEEYVKAYSDFYDELMK